ncbi:hypothetical protein FZC33_25665 [Labrys sp. KNU-23]|uniref:hypothetical protein n=1 Tax=Labrys sp. KNU-23 TaxID=2789216 RepID=UPI0011EFF166|nr:hypothetical protein [Labrys sp. KNU-23]QEN89491.1 hypothetical protein FZC33_25665 [Labrys sp. KNU-23]
MRKIIFAAAGCAIAAMAFADATAAMSVQDMAAGTYVRRDSGEATLVVKRTGEHWRVSAAIGGVPNGAATVADCGFIAEGSISGHAFEGKVTRVNIVADLNEEGEAANPGLGLAFSVDKGAITIRGADAAAICGGEGSVIDGVYKRRSR